jgi:hypothetical protein
MGLYDIYNGIQLKVGPCEIHTYEIGDAVPIDDGIYVAHEGIVVIHNSKFVARFDNIFTKWGDIVDPQTILDPHDYIKKAVKETIEKHKKKE